ncbi:DNA cytosine methyltransferase [Sulfitobacter sp.]|uniref:DNA cytosine methyltransferase n=1 Tax=Sulfitobacter sp. TaxID=1903071 RepID=UPI003298AF17
MMQVLDLFSGCGGLSLGAARAGLPPTVAIELDPTAAASHSLNFPSCRTLRLDLAETDPVFLKGLIHGRVDLLIGGPPCQGFSYMGKRNLEDPRNGLLKKFFDFVSVVSPRAFLMENVPGLLDRSSVHILNDALASLPSHYKLLPPQILDAADFGAATNRRRVIVIGYDSSDCDDISLEDFQGFVTQAVSAGTALGGLPEPGSSDIASVPKRMSPYIFKVNRPVKGIGGAESKEMFAAGKLTGFLATKHSAGVTERFQNTAPGAVEPTSRFFRLAKDKPARTLRAGTGSDRGSFQSARPIHFSSPRVISVREAARIQGFPDWFIFHTTKWHSHRMIGNSVNPIFAEAIVSPIAHALGANTPFKGCDG